MKFKFVFYPLVVAASVIKVLFVMTWDTSVRKRASGKLEAVFRDAVASSIRNWFSALSLESSC